MIYLDLYEVGPYEVFKGVILPLVAVFGFELIYRSLMLEISKDSVPKMQENLENDGFMELFELVIYLGGTRVLCLILVLSFMVMDKASSLYLWSTSFAMYFTANTLESLYA